MTLQLVRSARIATRSRCAAERRAQGAEVSRASPLDEPTDDPAARRRELLVVIELCAARARGARAIRGDAPASGCPSGERRKRARAPGRQTAATRALDRMPNVGQSAATVPKS